ncbi:MAG: hypothetical protein IJR71_05985 [Prevotella sp.]|nr:hypothetical protein [Prevotella sp.]
MSEIPIDKQRKDAEMLLQVVSEASGYSVDDIKHATKSYGINVARGVACVVSRELQIIPRIFGEVLERTRCNVVNISKHYRGYLSTKDKATVNLYEKVKQMLP